MVEHRSWKEIFGDAKRHAQLLGGIRLADSATAPEERIARWEKVVELWKSSDFRHIRSPHREQLLGSSLSKLGKAYYQRVRGDRADNLERSIAGFDAALKVFTRASFPGDWAATQMLRANAYAERICGRHADNLDAAIAGYDAALEVCTRAAFPKDWAAIQMNRANVYVRHVRGEMAGNIEHAIAGYDAALEIFARAAYPEHWAIIQKERAAAYNLRIVGLRADNREAAIAGHDAALEVFTRDAYPEAWAATQMNRAIAYDGRILGERADNLETAIASFNSALQVFTRSAFPVMWAGGQLNRAITYANRIYRDRADNLDAAIAGYDAALEVFTRAAFPGHWFRAQVHRARAYVLRIRGERADNIERATTGYLAALEVSTIETDPDMHLQACQGLGGALAAAGRWGEALEAFMQARRAAELLVGQGLDTAETERVLEDVQSLGPAMALAAANVGRPTEALMHLESGRARQLALGLRRSAARDALAPERRAEFDQRLAAMRTAQAELAAATPEARGSALAAVTAARGPFEAVLHEGQALAAAGEWSLDQRLAGLARAGITLAAPVFTSEGATLLIVPPGGATETIDLPGRALETLTGLLNGEDGWMAAYLASYRGDHSRFEEALRRVGEQVWTLFAGDLVAVLKARGVVPGSRLALLPQGALGLLPLGLACDPETGERLLDRYELSLTPNLAALDEKPEPASVSLAGVVNPTGDLPFTPVEGAMVASLLSIDAIKQVEGEDATRTSVLSLLDRKSHWHFSCHGAFDWQDPRRSGLKLANGEALTLGDLLEARAIDPPRLVVLSACETGLHDISRNPEEFIGLPAGFLERGAKGVLATLWRVNDASTSFLVYRFFELHIREGLRPAAALKAAQAWLRDLTRDDITSFANTHKAVLPPELWPSLLPLRGWDMSAPSPAPSDTRDKPFSDPFYWAGFVVHGA